VAFTPRGGRGSQLDQQTNMTSIPASRSLFACCSPSSRSTSASLVMTSSWHGPAVVSAGTTDCSASGLAGLGQATALRGENSGSIRAPRGARREERPSSSGSPLTVTAGSQALPPRCSIVAVRTEAVVPMMLRRRGNRTSGQPGNRRELCLRSPAFGRYVSQCADSRLHLVSFFRLLRDPCVPVTFIDCAKDHHVWPLDLMCTAGRHSR